MTMISVPTASTNGEPIALGTSDTTLHTPPSGKPDDIVLVFANISGGALTVTVTVGTGTPLPLSVGAGAVLTIGPFAATVAVKAKTTAATSIHALASVRR